MAESKGFKIESMVGKVGSRLQRYQSAVRHTETIFVAGRRLVMDRSITLTPAEFDKHSAEILKKIREGFIRMITPDGNIIDSLPGGALTQQRPGQKIEVEPKEERMKFSTESEDGEKTSDDEKTSDEKQGEQGTEGQPPDAPPAPPVDTTTETAPVTETAAETDVVPAATEGAAPATEVAEEPAEETVEGSSEEAKDGDDKKSGRRKRR